MTQYLPQFVSNREAFKIRLLAGLGCKSEKMKKSEAIICDLVISLSLVQTERLSRLGCLQDSVVKVKKMTKEKSKHCQRHNGPRVLTL